MRMLHLARLFRTVRYLKLSQIRYRVYYRLCKARIRRQALASVGNYRRRLWQQQWAAPCFQAQSYLRENEFNFLGEAGRVTTSSDWNQTTKSKLWLYNLHYFDDLNAAGADLRRHQHIELLNKWIEDNPPLRGCGWEPYPLSQRVVNWVKWCARQPEQEPHWLSSLARQAQALAAQIEYHILANHLLANAKALVFIGTFLEGEQADKWLIQGLRILDREITEQFLNDGGHFELSPMYHALLLWDICDLLNLAEKSGIEELKARVPVWHGVANRGFTWLAAMVHPDGEIPFFNDAALGVAPTLADLTTYAAMLEGDMLHRKSTAGGLDVSYCHLADSGYAAVNIANTGKAIIDIGNVGPDYQPGHAHADTLSFEFSIHGKRIIVNSGTSEYGDGPLRSKQRGTAAHNTLTIDKHNSSEVWGGFRVGRRASVIETAAFKEDDGNVRICGTHEGYRYLYGAPRHRRSWLFSPIQMELVDEVLGEGVHHVEIGFHLHPDCNVRLNRDNRQLTIELNGQTGYLLIIGGPGELSIRPSTYYPEFGRSVPNQRITCEWKGVLPMKWVTRLIWDDLPKDKNSESCIQILNQK